MTKTIEELDELLKKMLGAFQSGTTEEHEAMSNAFWKAKKDYYQPLSVELEAAFLRSAFGADRVDVVDGMLLIWDDPGGGWPPGPMYRWINFQGSEADRSGTFEYRLKGYKGTLLERVTEYLNGKRGDKT